MDLDPGTVVANRYRISRPLGRGGMGEVFAAENIRTGRPVAIKLLRQDSKQKSSAVARFRQEARAAGSINSDHVTQVLDVEEDAEHGVVLVFELLEGESLIDRLKRTGPVRYDELWSIIEQVWMGLADAHRAGIIHRDLKPSNVFLERRPDGATRVKILDFGISKVPKEAGGETLTEMGQSLGTFSFMPPEQIGKAKTVDHRADIYACTTLIFQSLTGQLPYAARNILIMVELKTKTDARSLGEAMGATFDARLEAFVARGLSRDPARRFQTALDALEAWRELRPQPSKAPPPGPRREAHSHAGVDVAASALRAPPPAIFDSSQPLPRVNAEIAEITSDETAATLAMPMAHLRKPGAAQATSPTARRPDSSASMRAVEQPAAPGRALSPMPFPTPAQNGALRTSQGLGPAPVDPRPAGAPGGAGTVPIPLVRSSAVSPSAAALPALASAGLPRVYDDPVSSQSGDGKTTVYKPRAEDGRPPAIDAALTPAKAKRSLPLVFVLLAFLLVGFVAVAGLMAIVRR